MTLYSNFINRLVIRNLDFFTYEIFIIFGIPVFEKSLGFLLWQTEEISQGNLYIINSIYVFKFSEYFSIFIILLRKMSDPNEIGNRKFCLHVEYLSLIQRIRN